MIKCWWVPTPTAVRPVRHTVRHVYTHYRAAKFILVCTVLGAPILPFLPPLRGAPSPAVPYAPEDLGPFGPIGLAAQVPEPSTYALMAFFVFILAAVRFKENISAADDVGLPSVFFFLLCFIFWAILLYNLI